MILKFELTDGESTFTYGVIVGVHGYIVTETDCCHALSKFGDTEELRYTWSDGVESAYTTISIGEMLDRATPVPVNKFVAYWGIKPRMRENYRILLDSVKEIGADLTQFPEWGEKETVNGIS
jgi:hypothetical protein